MKSKSTKRHFGLPKLCHLPKGEVNMLGHSKTIHKKVPFIVEGGKSIGRGSTNAVTSQGQRTDFFRIEAGNISWDI